jgi:phosphate transport system permease protein
MFNLFRSAAALNGLVLLVVVSFLVAKGWRAINWGFLTQAPAEAMTKGGILPCIVGTLCLSLGAILVAFPIGVASAVYLHEYARPGRTIRVIRLGINNLAGVPSVVFGLFGLAFFVIFLKMGVSILAGALTLGAMTLPVIIGASEEALRAVPQSYREASLALGASRWQTIYRVVLPAARSGVIIAVMLGIGRAIGETMAVMMITGNAARIPREWYALFLPARTMTATIAAEMGEVAQGSTHYHVLFAVGIVLFVVTFIINAIASAVVIRGGSRRSGRLMG